MRNNSKMRLISATILAAIILPMSVLPATQGKAQDPTLIEYSKLAERFTLDCDDLDARNRPTTERMRICLRISQELLDKLESFHKRLDRLVAGMRRGGKWTPSLDTQFKRDAAKLGIDQALAAEVQRAGGLRAFVEKSMRELGALKGQVAPEIKELETEINKSGPSEPSIDMDEAANAEAESTAFFLAAAKAGAKLAKKLAILVLAACELSKFCD